jgi:predicted transposase/invertase (TIGR01784 family)
LKAVYLIALLNFRQNTISEELRTDVALVDMKHKTLFSDKLRMVFLQLPYFTKEAEKCETLFDRIIYVLKHMDVLKRMPWMAQEAVFQKLASIADVASLSKQERIAYDENLRKYRDTVAVMEGQWLEGHAKGVEEGVIKIARNLKSMGMSVEDIAKATGLTVEEIAIL